jgi:hypothetical protein
VFDALDAEWAYLAANSRLRAAAARWATEDPALAGLADPVALLAAGQDLTDRPRVAAVTLALVRVAAGEPGTPADAGHGARADEVAQPAGPPAGHVVGEVVKAVDPGARVAGRGPEYACEVAQPAGPLAGHVAQVADRVAEQVDQVACEVAQSAGHGSGRVGLVAGEVAQSAGEVARGVPAAVADTADVDAGAVGAADGELAVRVLVQVLLPGLKTLCAQTWWVPRAPGGGSLWLAADHEERAAVALELLVAGIRGYRWRTRRGPANLNLLGDTRTQLLRLVDRARRADRSLRLAADLDAAGADHRAAPGVDEHVYYARALAGLLRWALRTRVLSEEAVRLVAQTRLADRSPEELAAEHGVAVHSLRRRRQRAEAALAAAARAAGRWPLPDAA